MISVNASPPITSQQDGIRPVKLSTDLAPLADLIELSFRHTMDENGRAAIREMRYMSKMGAGLNILGRVNDLTIGINMGFVWIQNGHLVGNVSIYPANWQVDLGQAWIIANVAVHPDYQRRGIARKLMIASLDAIQQKGGKHAILQVDYDNRSAIKLYEGLNFVRERAFTTWWRTSMTSRPPHIDSDIHITRPRRSDFDAEYALAKAQRPNHRGGIGWLKPVHMRVYKPSLWQQVSSIFSMNNDERLIIRSQDKSAILADLTIARGFGMSRTRLTLIADPAAHDDCVPPLVTSVLRRYRSTAFVIEHPHDDKAMTKLLHEYRFFPHRTVWHMRLSQ